MPRVRGRGQICLQIGLAESAVKVHVAEILKKLERHSRTQAAVLVKALEHGDEA
ncbi:LuxR C-terminal-related transcriptional regulator [Luteimonas terrae]|uniref:DNA-binding NarL/FixJ family response regulator n=1 Tax=Luteimonas terrae TaxID=1530191 RepID=A0ABU1XST6_9GAMM|nr:DNA-binding NarL/FixJ family response regulator [Luteimonas terrae]